MKKMFSIVTMVLIFCAYFTSCEKPSTPQTSSKSVQPKMQFYANGVLMNFDAIAEPTLGWIEYPSIDSILALNAGFWVSGHNSKNDLNLGLCRNCSTITVGAYPTAGGKNIDSGFGEFGYHLNQGGGGGTYTINITSYKNRLASGTFSAILTPDDAAGPVMNITNGTFENLPMR